MKKRTNLVLLVLLCLSTTLFLQEGQAFDNTNTTTNLLKPNAEVAAVGVIGPKIVITNWDNEMDIHGCIMVDEGGAYGLGVNVTVTLEYDDISPFPPLFLAYDFGGYLVGRTKQITNDILVPGIDNGVPVYQVTLPYDIDVTQLCNFGNNPHQFQFTLTLQTIDTGAGAGTGGQMGGETAVFMDYPVAQYQGTLFPEHLFIDENGIPIPPTADIIGDKEICCQEYGAERSQAVEALQSPVAQDFQVSPNPFGHQIIIAAQEPLANIQQVELFNAAGQRVYVENLLDKSQANRQLIIDTQDLTNGFYYCRVNNGKSYKIVKFEH